MFLSSRQTSSLTFFAQLPQNSQQCEEIICSWLKAVSQLESDARGKAMKGVDQWQKGISRRWLRERAEISTQVLHPTTILDACCRQRVLRQMLVLLRRKVRPLMYYQAINSVEEARSSITMRFKDQFCGREKNDFFLSPSGSGICDFLHLCAHTGWRKCASSIFFNLVFLLMPESLHAW